ncbi:hypothetical protein PF008_g18257 [Phytophthora fragariae]|uniref:Uncharacterized protein n=1 Tax=Phytophthora fragariae TaxID=53985 RepID=A0A6G0R760_9STRA|nr:hypothetical protein PF008_g18257 [Phytophthora fragariae]
MAGPVGVVWTVLWGQCRPTWGRLEGKRHRRSAGCAPRLRGCRRSDPCARCRGRRKFRVGPFGGT